MGTHFEDAPLEPAAEVAGVVAVLLAATAVLDGVGVDVSVTPTAAQSAAEYCSALVRSLPLHAPSIHCVVDEMNVWSLQRHTLSSDAHEPKFAFWRQGMAQAVADR